MMAVHAAAVRDTALMVIGIDARAAAEVPAGRGRVVRELLAALETLDPPHRFVLYCREPWEERSLGGRFEWTRLGLQDPFWHAAAALHATRRCDVFLSTNSYLTAWILLRPCVVLVHDLIAFLPQTRPQRRAAWIERATIRPAVRRASRLLCNSRSTERDLVRLFPSAVGKTTVVPFAANARFHERRGASDLEATAARYGVQADRFVLAAGTLEPRKNLLRLIRSHAALPDHLKRDHPLLIVGPKGWQEDEILHAAAASGDHVRLAGYVPDEDLASLYGAATVFCYPSLYEGFGLPVLEAMAAGAVVVTSDVSSLPEVGGEAVAYVDPENERSIAAALERLLSLPEERTRLAELARSRAAEYSWDRVARAILDEVERAARER
jgi:glycosyltransferase involved in cell wall biosynthesis